MILGVVGFYLLTIQINSYISKIDIIKRLLPVHSDWSIAVFYRDRVHLV